jgi:hypothetical protein
MAGNGTSLIILVMEGSRGESGDAMLIVALVVACSCRRPTMSSSVTRSPDIVDGTHLCGKAIAICEGTAVI